MVSSSSGKAESSEAWQVSDPGHAELVKLRVRIIALENLLLAVLADADEGLRERIRKRVDEIQSRDNATDHPLTESAGTEMLRLLDRADRL